MTKRTFIDSNVFVYAEDDDEPGKRDTAREVIRQLARDQRGVVSTQVLVEYVAAARRRLKLTLPQCRETVLAICRFEVALIRPEYVLDALDLANSYSLSHWDALILTAAARSGCQVLVSEDLRHGQTINGVTLHNPFA